MLEELQLDTQGFSNLFRKARSQIPELYPPWSNYNYHDPGITLLELFAFFTEAQQFYLDQVDEDLSLAFLHLLGTRPKPATPARVWAEASAPQTVKIGQSFFAGDLCFQAIDHHIIPDNRLLGVEIRSPEGKIHRETLAENALGFSCYPFGAEATPGTQFTLFFQKPLEPKQTYHLTTLVEDRHSLPRTPIPPGYPFVPLATLTMAYYHDQEMRHLPFDDTSYGFLQDGVISFTLDAPMHPHPQGTLSPYALQITLSHSQYDVPPVISHLSCWDLPLEQRETLVTLIPVEALPQHQQQGREALYLCQEGEHFRTVPSHQGDWVALYDPRLLAEGVLPPEVLSQGILAQGNGFPSQRYPLSHQQILPHSVRIFLEDEDQPGRFHPYTYVENFFGSTPESRHFTIDLASGELVFGDGFAGYPPESKILLLGLAVTQGKAGNLSKGSALTPSEITQTTLHTLQDARGGRQAEGVPECFARLQDSLEHPQRLVSLQDIQTIVKETPGLRIQDCILKPGAQGETSHPNLLHLVVKPYGQDRPTLSTAYQENILQYLQDKRLVGTYIQLHSPRYVTIDLYVEVRAHPTFGGIGPRLTSLLQTHFAQITGFGATIAYHKLYHLIQEEPGIASIQELSILAKGEGATRQANGDVVLPPSALVFLGQVRSVIQNS